MTLSYDFWIGDVGSGLGFNKYITKDNTYERATAQFRKDQFDSQSNVGDQSLTGWWTRGQLSFHKGAGVTYYEVLDGDTVLNRYKDSDSVAVFEPGEVTLTPRLSSLSLDATDVVPAPLTSGGGIYALTSTGVTYTAGTSTVDVDTSDSGVPTSITSSGTLYYVANGDGIERQFVATEARTNHVTNPSFEVDGTGWTFTSSGSHGSMATSTVRSKYGTRSLTMPHGGWGEDSTATHVMTGLSIGQVYIVSVWVYVQSGAPIPNGHYGTRLKIDSTTIATDTATADGWVRLSGTFTATATSHSIKVVNGPSISTTGGSPSTSAIYIDAVLFTESPYSADYFDGSLPGAAWAGTANASKSTIGMSTGTASVVRVTNSSSDWDRVWWAKGRLFAVDTDGYFYALPDATDSVTNADAFWSTGRTDIGWSLTDSPASVYISDGSSIYAVSIDTDGLVPSLDAPTTVAQVPLGESISSIGYYLGYLIVATSAGVRVALVQDGKVFLGPLVIEGDFSAAGRVGFWDTLAYVVGRPSGRDGNYVLCAVDLSQFVSELIPAWSPVATLSEVASTANGVVVDAAGVLYSWAAGDTYVSSRDELVTGGSLTTGFHRFGTLDSKFFARLSVRLKGTGEVEVFQVADDETETSLGTLDAAVGVGEIDLIGDPAERIALKFVLSRDETDSTKGPTLLGYQLKALPVPKRQRMIRVPLMLLDYEVDGKTRTSRGSKGNAWTRLATLEALEESNAVVSFTDSETGETGSAYIEAIEVRRESPVSPQGDGFGGLLYVTLRKLA